MPCEVDILPHASTRVSEPRLLGQCQPPVQRGKNMKSLRLLIFLLALGAVSLLPGRAYAQQEVDPDHFDQPAASVASSKAHNSKMASVDHHSHPNHESPADTQPEKGIIDRYTRSIAREQSKAGLLAAARIATAWLRLSRRPQNSNLTVVAILGDSRSAITSAKPPVHDQPK